MSYNHNNGDEFEFEKDIDVEADFYVGWEYENEIDSEVYVDHDIESYVDLEGNSAVLNLNVEAVGDDTLVEASAVVLTTDYYSGITVTAVSAVD